MKLFITILIVDILPILTASYLAKRIYFIEVSDKTCPTTKRYIYCLLTFIIFIKLFGSIISIISNNISIILFTTLSVIFLFKKVFEIDEKYYHAGLNWKNARKPCIQTDLKQKDEKKSKLLIFSVLWSIIIVYILFIISLYCLNLDLLLCLPPIMSVMFSILLIISKKVLCVLPKNILPNNFSLFIHEKFDLDHFVENLFTKEWFLSRFILFLGINLICYVSFSIPQVKFLNPFLILLLTISWLFTILISTNHKQNFGWKSFACLWLLIFICLLGSRYSFIWIINIYSFKLLNIKQIDFKILSDFLYNNIKLYKINSTNNYNYILENGRKLFYFLYLDNNYNAKINSFTFKLISWLYKDSIIYDTSRIKYVKTLNSTVIFGKKIHLPNWSYANATTSCLKLFNIDYNIKMNFIFCLYNFTINEFIYNYSINGIKLMETTVSKSNIIPRLAKNFPQTLYEPKQILCNNNFNENSNNIIQNTKDLIIKPFYFNKIINYYDYNKFKIFEILNEDTFFKFNSIKNCVHPIFNYTFSTLGAPKSIVLGNTSNLEFSIDSLFNTIELLNIHIYPRLAFIFRNFTRENFVWSNNRDAYLHAYYDISHSLPNLLEEYTIKFADFDSIMSDIYHLHNDVFMKIHNLHKPHYYISDEQLGFLEFFNTQHDEGLMPGQIFTWQIYTFMYEDYIRFTPNANIANFFENYYNGIIENYYRTDDAYKLLRQHKPYSESRNWVSTDHNIYNGQTLNEQEKQDRLLSILGILNEKNNYSKYNPLIENPLSSIGISTEQILDLLEAGKNSNINRVRNLRYMDFYKSEYRGFIDVSCKITNVVSH